MSSWPHLVYFRSDDNTTHPTCTNTHKQTATLLQCSPTNQNTAHARLRCTYATKTAAASTRVAAVAREMTELPPMNAGAALASGASIVEGTVSPVATHAHVKSCTATRHTWYRTFSTCKGQHSNPQRSTQHGPATFKSCSLLVNANMRNNYAGAVKQKCALLRCTFEASQYQSRSHGRMHSI